MHLKLLFLGPFEVTVEGNPAQFATDRARALLTYLAVEAGCPHRREALAGLLWSDRPESVARANLSQALARLRRAIDDYHADPPFLDITPKTIEFTAIETMLDVAEFRELLAACAHHDHDHREGCEACIHRLEQAAALYRGDLVQGFLMDSGSLFDEWLLVTREQLHGQAMEVLYTLSRYHLERAEYGLAESYARRQLALEPWREEAHCQLMQALAAGGQRSAALAQFQACRQLLGEELGAEPMAETEALYEAIRAGTLSRSQPAPTARLAPAPAWSRSTPGPVFVGREPELSRLGEFLEPVLAGHGRVALISGEVGSGKTALASEFSRRAAERHHDLVFATGRCDAFGGIGDPYLPFSEVMAQLTGDVDAGRAAGTLTEGNAARLLALAPVAREAIATCGPELIGRLVSGADLLARTPALIPGWQGQLGQRAAGASASQAQPANLFEQYAAVLRTLASHRPLLIVMDDLHWADASSLALLFYLSRHLSGSRILLLGTYRPEDVPGGEEPAAPSLMAIAGEFKRAFGRIEIDLDRGTEEMGRDMAERQFIDALLDSEPNGLDEAFRHALVERTRGQPLFTTELLREMRERGDLVLDAEGRWVATPGLEWGGLPARVEGVIERRVGRLSPDVRAALRVACVEGQEFTAEVVARVQGAGEQQVIRQLSSEAVRRHRLLSAPSLQWIGSQPVSRYRFRHPLFQQYLYETLDEAERAYLHGAVGRALTALYGDQVDRIAAQLAWHLESSSSPHT